LNPPAPNAPTSGRREGNIPLPDPLKVRIKAGLVAVTMAAWCFVRVWAHLLCRRQDYFSGPPILPVELLALAVNILVLGLVIYLGIGVWMRLPRGTAAAAALELVFLFLLVFPADFVRVQVLDWTNAQFVIFLKRPGNVLCIVAIALMAIWQHRQAARALALLVAVTLPLVLWLMLEVVLVWLNLVTLPGCPPAPPSPPLLHARADQPRVVWIIFDETDYRLAFEKRPANVRLPEMDRLRGESLCPDHAYPPSDSTLLSMPILISGQHMLAARNNGCDLDLTPAEGGATVNWSGMPSVFSEARELGVNTALVGWYHPYGRMLGGSLNYSSSYPFPLYEFGRATTFGGAVKEQLFCLLEPICFRQIYIEDCEGSLADGAAVAANPDYGLVLLHLPPPHGPWVYLPEGKRFTWFGAAAPRGYFNNLMLADDELGVLRRAMERAGQWAGSWVILSADHSWRASQCYDGVRDYRVPFLVKSAGESHSMAYSHPFNTAVLTHDLILGILRREVRDEAGAAGVLDRGEAEMPILRSQPASSQ